MVWLQYGFWTNAYPEIRAGFVAPNKCQPPTLRKTDLDLDARPFILIPIGSLHYAEVAIGNMVRRVLNIIREEYAEEPADEFGTSSTEAAPSREQLKSLKTLVTKNLDKACAAADWWILPVA
jgi:hypothetical protein